MMLKPRGIARRQGFDVGDARPAGMSSGMAKRSM